MSSTKLSINTSKTQPKKKLVGTSPQFILPIAPSTSSAQNNLIAEPLYAPKIHLAKGETVIYKRKESDEVSNSSKSTNLSLNSQPFQPKRRSRYVVNEEDKDEGLTLAAVMKVSDCIDLRSVVKETKELKLVTDYVPKTSNGKNKN